MKDITIAITAASYSGNKGAYAMLQSSIKQLRDIFGDRLKINLMSVYPEEDKKQAPFDFISVIPARPQQLLFIAFPLAIIYKLLSWIPFAKKLFKLNKIIRAYLSTDLVIDEAGVSFIDSRGLIMNTYAFVCAAVPLLLGVPVVKYSQALGPFNSPVNRLLAKWILPKLHLICARGEITFNHLKSIGIVKNVKICADGAFTMPDDYSIAETVKGICERDIFYKSKERIVSLSLSSVVQKKCNKLGIDYIGTMSQFIDYLNDNGYKVLIIANAAREGSRRPRNNDLMVCNAVYEKVQNKEMVRWYPREMKAEEIREFISHTHVLVASRFHAMIGALEKGIPTLLIGWSHKYKEVLDMFELGKYAVDYSELTFNGLIDNFNSFINNREEIQRKIIKNLDSVKASSRQNIIYISQIINKVITAPKKKVLLDVSNPNRYLGNHITCRIGYAKDEKIRKNSASGGMVTALLCHLIRTNQIDGAWVTKSEIVNGKLGYKTFVATTEEEIKDCSSSIYMYMPLLNHINDILQFDGKLAVVLLPCQMKALSYIIEKRPEIKKKIALKICLYCSGVHSKSATLIPLEKKKLSLDDAVRIYYRRGHWRGLTTIKYGNGQEKTIPYSWTICAYKNAYFFIKEACLICQDHFGESSDISFGDVWLREMKKNPIKHTGCIIRSEKALEMYRSAVNSGVIVDSSISDEKVIYSQKRSLVFKFNCAKAKVHAYKKLGKTLNLDTLSHCKLNHWLAYKLAYFNMKLSRNHEAIIKKIPLPLIYLYMLFIRFLLSF